MRTQSDNKRIVSKVEYAGIMGGRFLGYAASMFFFAVGCGGAILSGIAALSLLAAMIGSGDPMALCFFLLLAAILAFALFFGMAIAGWRGLKSLEEEEEILPLTRQTALDIPAEQSLVRASSAETLAAETVLLRPAQAQNETANEELLRPHSER